jgi:hypothetical protein
VKAEESIARLRKVEVFETEKVVVQWSVKLPDGATVSGRADPGRVKLSSDAGSLSIYLTRSDIDPSSPPVELGEELCKYCGITRADQGILLQQILAGVNLQKIRRVVERRGLFVEEFEAELQMPMDNCRLHKFDIGFHQISTDFPVLICSA